MLEITEFVRLSSRAPHDVIPNFAVTRTSDRKAEIQSRMPTPSEVALYIQELDGSDLRHTVPEVSQHFLGVMLDTRKDILLYNQVFARIQKAQKILARKRGRKFFGMREPSGDGQRGNIMVYRLEPERELKLIPEEPKFTIIRGGKVTG
ncbi:MAG TPA: hypothetical protein VGS11_04935 [Candidatus Bathyarchaeia archaeon]|nr:hypothetical protein [Candidatus Bathyarchaeia archaeon]